MLYRFPNMVVAQVTRESVQQAIASGITAQQVSLLGMEVGRWVVLVLGRQGLPAVEAYLQLYWARGKASTKDAVSGTETAQTAFCVLVFS